MNTSRRCACAHRPDRCRRNCPRRIQLAVPACLYRTRRRSARARRPGDRRALYIEPTATGRRLIAKLLADQMEACREMLSPLNPAEREELIRLTALMAQA